MARRLTLLLNVALLSLLVFVVCGTRSASAHHMTYLPLVPNTPLMQTVIKTQSYNWCVDARASAYPGFVSQLIDVNDQYTKRVGIKHAQVPWGDPSCKVRHNMPESFSCGECAANIFYANTIVDVNYKWQFGFTDWRSAQGHELGHGLLGLHEQYIDLGSIQCTGRQDTVMDCGSGVRYPTTRDTDAGCAIILTGWCGKDASVADRYYFADGWSYEFSTGDWWNPQNVREWSRCNADLLRWNYVLGVWTPQGAAFYLPSRGFWSLAGAC